MSGAASIRLEPERHQLKVKPQSELNDAPAMRRVENYTEAAWSIGEVRIWITKSDAVKSVEHVRAELQ